MQTRSFVPVVTALLIAANVLAYVAQMSTPSLTEQYALIPARAAEEPYRIVTGAFLHSTSSYTHIVGNMLSLWFIGRFVERWMGHVLFAVLYALSLLGGSFAAIALTPDPNTLIVGASGAIFGVLAASAVMSLFAGSGLLMSLGFLGANIAYGFVVPGISWQAHVGGAVVGLVFALIAAPVKKAAERRRRAEQSHGLAVGDTSRIAR